MDITVSDAGGLWTRVTLVGKLDIMGAQAIEMPLSTIAGARNNIVVDMDGVDFIASIGIRHLVMAAKTVGRASKKLLLLSPKPQVREVLATAGLENLLPIVHSEDEVRAALAQ